MLIGTVHYCILVVVPVTAGSGSSLGVGSGILGMVLRIGRPGERGGREGKREGGRGREREGGRGERGRGRTKRERDIFTQSMLVKCVVLTGCSCLGCCILFISGAKGSCKDGR